MFDLQAGPNGANRAKQLRRVMAANAKVRDALIAREIMRIKCASLGGLINPTSSLSKPQNLHENNSEGEGRSAANQLSHGDANGKQQQQVADSSAKSSASEIDASETGDSISSLTRQKMRAEQNAGNKGQVLANKPNAERKPAQQPNVNREAEEDIDAGVDSASAGVDSALTPGITHEKWNSKLATEGADNNPAQCTPGAKQREPDTGEWEVPPAGSGPTTVTWSDVRRRGIFGDDDDSVGSAASSLQP